MFSKLLSSKPDDLNTTASGLSQLHEIESAASAISEKCKAVFDKTTLNEEATPISDIQSADAHVSEGAKKHISSWILSRQTRAIVSALLLAFLQGIVIPSISLASEPTPNPKKATKIAPEETRDYWIKMIETGHAMEVLEKGEFIKKKSWGVEIFMKAAEKLLEKEISSFKNKLMNVAKKLPPEHASSLKNLILDIDPTSPDGENGEIKFDGTIILKNWHGRTHEKVAATFLHEMGHNVDLQCFMGKCLSGIKKRQDRTSEFLFKGWLPIYEGDPSLLFYRLSWENTNTKKKGSTDLDFVSGYSMSDPSEDFAETYAYYILHNKNFKARTQTNNVLLKKYEFMRNVVFKGKIYDTGECTSSDSNRQRSNVSNIPYDLEDFLENK